MLPTNFEKKWKKVKKEEVAEEQRHKGTKIKEKVPEIPKSFTRYALLTTQYAQRTPFHGDFFEISPPFKLGFRIILNEFVYRM